MGLFGGHKSLPMRERGLKYVGGEALSYETASLPMRERGLKYGTFQICTNYHGCRSPCGSVD